MILISRKTKCIQTSPGYTGPIENYCGVHVERQVSTSGWKYRIQRGGLRDVNPTHVGGLSTKIQQTRSALFVCEEDNCNSYGTQYWPLPPIILPSLGYLLKLFRSKKVFK